MKSTKAIRSEQESGGIDRGARIEAEIETILASEEELIPSSGFLASVMEQVWQEAALPPPLPFPWKWAVPGILLAGGVSGWSAFELVHLGLPARDMRILNSLAFPAPHYSAALVAPIESAGWVALALGVSLLCWLFSRRLAGSGGLL